jgi:hypothetical protein
MKVYEWIGTRMPKCDTPDEELRAFIILLRELCELELAQIHNEQELVCNPKKSKKGK